LVQCDLARWVEYRKGMIVVLLSMRSRPAQSLTMYPITISTTACALGCVDISQMNTGGSHY